MSSEPPFPDSNPAAKQAAKDVVEATEDKNSVANPMPVCEPDHSEAGSLVNVGADELSYLHGSSLIFDLLAHGKTYLVPAAFGLWGAANGDLKMLVISALIFIPAFLTSVFRYFTYRYCIVDGQLIVRQGLIFRNVRTIPVARIQNIDFVQNPLHRILRVAEVKVETASGTKPEATLRVLSIAQMERLRDSVFGRVNPRSATAPEPPDKQPIQFPSAANSLVTHGPSDETAACHNEVTTLLEIPISWLVKAGLASNRGMIMIGVLVGAYFQFADRQSFFKFESYQHLMPEHTSTALIIVAAVGGTMGALLFLRLLGIGWFVLRFQGYRLVRHGEDLRISCGLMTKVSATVPRQRVQFISIHRNLIMRCFGLASIRIETAGGAGNQGENATESVSKRWFIPVIPELRVAELLASIRPELEWDESKLDFKPLAEKTTQRLCRLALVQSVILSGLGVAITRPWGWLVGVAALPVLLLWAVKKSRAMRYARTDKGVVYRSGVLIRKTSVTFFEKIQTLRVDQSPFDRRWKMARLSVDTAAAGPADHRIEVPYLDENFAREELQLLRTKTGQQQPVFGL